MLAEASDTAKALRVALFAVGYPTSIAVLTRWVPVVRERRWRWLVVHHLGVSAVIAGCALRRTAIGVVANSAWLVVSSAWYALGGGQRSGAAS